MSRKAEHDYQSTLLNIATNELTSHGAMLFAVSISSFTFLRIINDYYINRFPNIPILNNIILWVFLSILFGVSFYVFFRLIYWARVLSSAFFVTQDSEHTSFAIYALAVFENTRERLQRSKFEKSVIYPFIPKGRFPSWRVIIYDLVVGALISFILIYALGGW